MNTLRATHTILVITFAARFAMGGGPIQSLPNDGAWVKFSMEWDLSGPTASDSGGKGTWTIRSVGKRILDGEKCRWIEIEEHLEKGLDEKDHTRWYKFLIREKDLKPGGDPLKSAVEVWYKNTENVRLPRKVSNKAALLPMFFHGTPVKSKRIDQKMQVVWEKGTFKFKKAEKQQLKIKTSGGPVLLIEDIIWKKSEVPFGVAGANLSTRFVRDGKDNWIWARELRLKDFGTGSKSSFPNLK